MYILKPLTERFYKLYLGQYELIEFGKLVNYEQGWFVKCRDQFGIVRFKSLR